MAPLSEASSSSSGQRDAPSRLILTACREIKNEEKQILSKHFANIVYYDSQLHQGKLDLNELAFDLLIVDANNPSNHTFLEVISAQAAKLSIKIVVLKKSMTNSKELAEALNASVISGIEDYEASNFQLYLTKCKLPKLVGRIKHLVKKIFALFSGC